MELENLLAIVIVLQNLILCVQFSATNVSSVKSGSTGRKNIFSDVNGKELRAKKRILELDRTVGTLNRIISSVNIARETAGQSTPKHELNSELSFDEEQRTKAARVRPLKYRKIVASYQSNKFVSFQAPFADFDTYMRTPVEKFSTIDDNLVTRLSDRTFRFSVPVKNLIGLNIFPSIDVAVSPASHDKNSFRIYSFGYTMHEAKKPMQNDELISMEIGPYTSEAQIIDSKATVTDGKHKFFEARFDGTLTWEDSVEETYETGTYQPTIDASMVEHGSCRLSCDLLVEVSVTFATSIVRFIPSVVLKKPIELILSAVINSLLPYLLSALVQDFIDRLLAKKSVNCDR